MSAKKIVSGLKISLHKSWKRLLFLTIVVTITIVTHVLIAMWLSRSSVANIPSMGTIYVTGVEAYGGDIKLVDGFSSIDWGTIQYNNSKSVSFYLRSISSVPTMLSFNATDWNPERMKNYVTLSWSYNGTQLAPKQEIMVTFTLSAPDSRDFADYLISNAVSAYNFTIHIFATEL